jgi:hypothetical protein
MDVPPLSDGSVGDASAQDVPSADATHCTIADSGTLQTNYYCDLGIIHVLRHTTGSNRVVVQARVGTGMPTCGAIDSVDILRGSTMLAHLGASPLVTLGSQSADIASGDAPTALVSECANETTRLTAYGLVIRGRDERGPFEARCGTAESGGRWPPGTSLACHQNIERPPLGNASITQSNSTFGSSANLSINFPHRAGTPAATSIGGVIRVVSPQYAPFQGGTPLLSHDTSGWTGGTSESDTVWGPTTQATVMYFGSMPAFDSTLCPPPSMPGPGSPLPPWYLARVSGQGSEGAFSAEVLTSCVTLPSH